MYQKYSLSGTLLTRCSISILITLLGYPFDLLLTKRISSNNFPIETWVLISTLTIHQTGNFLSNIRTSSKMNQFDLLFVLLKNLLHLTSITMNHIKWVFRHITSFQHMNKNLKNRRHSLISLNKNFIPCNKSTHQLKYWNLNREIKWSNYANLTKRESVAIRNLTFMISCNWKPSCYEPWIVSTEVF